MKLVRLDKYSIAALLFMALAAVLIAVALVSGLGEFVTASFVISGMVSAMTGIFLLTFSGGEPFDAKVVGLLPAQASLNLCQITSDLGIPGNAFLLPRSMTGKTRVMQFNPASGYTGSPVSVEGSFPKTGPQGLITIPSGESLIQVLRHRNALVVPENRLSITQLIREIIEEIFEFAPRVSAQNDGNRFTITLQRYRLIEGCRFIVQQSATCCAKHPCPVCSLCGIVIAEGTNQIVALEQCSASPSNKNVVMIYSVVSSSSLSVSEENTR